MPDPVVPAVLLAQDGGHNHVLTIGINIGPLMLRVALLAAICVVACFALLRGFLAEPRRRELVWVVATAGGAVALELLLSGGLNFPDQVVPLLLALLAGALYLTLSRDPRFAAAVGRLRRLAPWVFWPVAAVAVVEFGRALLAGAGLARTATLLHTSVVLALVALAWFAVSRPRGTAGTVALRVGGFLLAMVLVVGTAQATLAGG